MSTKSLFFLLPAILLVGCATSMDQYSYNGGSLHNYFTNNNYASIVSRANQFCSSKGLGPPDINKVSSGCFAFCGSEYDKYQFTCQQRLEIPTYRPQVTSQTNSSSQSIDAAKEKCSNMGLKAGTENFGKCVLQLTK